MSLVGEGSKKDQKKEKIEEKEESSDKDKEIEDDDPNFDSRTSQFYNKQNNIKTLRNKEELTRYYEIEIKQIDKIGDQIDDLTYINIVDVTTIMKGQQKFSDSIY